MSYTALYRKFRPSTFEDVKGQDHIVKALKNQIKADRIGHAYLFCGTRGTGKTSVAKILANAVNCEHPIDGSPCNECEMCKKASQHLSMNVIEIDAASNNRVDNIREIIDEVRYSPTEGRYKVYIIDEVHMLSAGAFNALLKTLEEPPSYVIFILATTEVHKIPITILSRCQRYNFKRITIDTIAERLMELTEKENISVEDRALRYIAKVADGSLRDALSLLDQCIAFYLGESLTFDKVIDVLGAVDVDVFNKILMIILNTDVPGAMNLVEDIVITGKELGQFVIDFTWYLRNLLLLKTSKNTEENIDLSSEQIEVLRHTAELVSVDSLMRYIRIFSELSNQIKYSSQKRVLLELALIKLCIPEMEQNYDSLLDRIAKIENQMSQGVVVRPTTEKVEVQNVNVEEKQASQSIVVQQALPEDIEKIAKDWDIIKGSLSGPVKANLANVSLSVTGDSLVLVFKESISYNLIKQDNIDEIQDAIRECTHKEVKVLTKLIESNENTDNIIDIRNMVNMPIEFEE